MSPVSVGLPQQRASRRPRQAPSTATISGSLTALSPLLAGKTEAARILLAKDRTASESLQRALSMDVLKVRLRLALNRSVTATVIASWAPLEPSPVVLRRLLRLPNSAGSHDTILVRLNAVADPQALANRVSTARYTSDTTVINVAAQDQNPETVYAALTNPNCPTDTLLRVCYSSKSPAWKRNTAKKHANCPTEGEIALFLTEPAPLVLGPDGWYSLNRARILRKGSEE